MNGYQASPFALTKTERQTLRDCVKVLMAGGNPANDEELKQDWKKWEFFAEVAFFALDSRYGNWLMCPIGTTPAELGVKTYETLEIIRGLYREKLNVEMNSALHKSRR